MGKILNWFNSLNFVVKIKKWYSNLSIAKQMVINFILVYFLFSWVIGASLVIFLPGGLVGWILSVVLLLLATICAYILYKINKKIAIFLISISLIAMFVCLILFSSAIGGDGDSDGCSICGKPVFAGRLCEKHFNDSVKSKDKKNQIILEIVE